MRRGDAAGPATQGGDATQPNGQPRRKLDTSRALERFGWKATTPLAEGLCKTLDWYLGSR
jgi:nucleoside-diphosphate-sugar epimerase